MLDKTEEPAAVFRGTIGRVSTVPSRGVVIVSVEAPLEHHGLVARIAVHGQHVVVAAIQTPEKKPTEKKRWNDLTPQAQAGILCNDPEFWVFLLVDDAPQTIAKIYDRCKISSRAELSTNSRAAREWSSLVNDFRVWQQARP